MKTLSLRSVNNNQKGAIFTESIIAIPAFFLIIFGLVELSSYLIFRNTVTSALTRAASLAAIVQGLDSNDWPTRRAATLAVRKLAYEGMTGLIVRKESSTASNRLVAPTLATRKDKDLWPSDLSSSDPIFTQYTPIEVILPPLTVEEKQLFKTSWGAGVMRKKMRVDPIRITTKLVYSPLLLRWLPLEATIAAPLEFHVSAYREVVNTDVEPAALDCNGEEIMPNSVTVCPCLLTDPARVYDSQGQCVCKPGYTEDPVTSKCICSSNSYVDSEGNCKPCPTCHTANAKYYDENGMCGCCASPLLAYSYWAIPPPATSNYSVYPATTTTSIKPPEKCYCPRNAAYCNSYYGKDYIFNQATCACDPCPPGLYRTSSDSVMCTGCYASWNGVVPTQYSATWTGCSCNVQEKALTCPGAPVDPTTCQCKPVCGAGMKVRGDKLACECDSATLNCASNETIKNDSTSCQCEVCPSPKVVKFNNSQNAYQCVCDPTALGLYCLSIGAGPAIDNSTTPCSCSSGCPEGTVVSDDGRYCACLVDGNGKNTCPANYTTTQSPTGSPQCNCEQCKNDGTGNQSQLWPYYTANAQSYSQYSSGACTCALNSALCKTQLGSQSAMLNYVNCTCTDPCKNFTCTGNAQALPAIDTYGNATCNCQGE